MKTAFRNVNGATGGVCGYASSGSSIEKSMNTGSIMQTNTNEGITSLSANELASCGGILGKGYSASITNCYNWGSAEAKYAGGIIGYDSSSLSSTLTNVYNTGEISGSSYTGGLIGYCSGTSTLTNYYFLSGVSGIGNLIGEYGISKTSANMQKESFAESLGEAFVYNEGGYPLLAWEAEASTPIATPITTIEPSESTTTTKETTTTTESTITTTQTTTTTTTQSTTTTNTTTTEKRSCAFTLKEPYTGDLYVGNTFQLEYDTEDGYTGGAAWHTSDSTVATISQTGEVTIVGEGTVTIYVMDDNGNTSSITFTTFTLRTTATTETTTTETTTTAIGNPTQCGDVDLDGYVTLADAILLNKSLVSGIQLNAEQTANANVYADDEITSMDAMYLLKFIVPTVLLNKMPHFFH